ncbi:hypothetical protein [Streptomyces paromomycinus]|uniref:Protein kinase domain-containing protein n=1 Tax=Streptomyces paromomycinus TaxID=92743 RepID=A0A401VYT5_STREY|nr:hypothetical protein [Streptomyces paromomycinus]GCD42243.1 hypothetical protein GKJPGBOP_01902 [Streptomyces paromomycinus]
MGPPAGPQRQFPSGAAYAEALQHTRLCFQHPELKGARTELTKLGLPRAVSGAFASVFSLTSAVSGQRYAVKCFTRHVPDQEQRYEAISSRLALLDPVELSQPWKLGFEYLPDAVCVGRHLYPVLKMDWVEAVTLSAWLDAHHADRPAVSGLADRFAALTRDLSAHGIAHGDLQHGNLLVASDGTFRLVDYDGMYVPALAGLGGTERGHRNYQSPLRGNDDFGAELDRFSAWVIFLSLKAIATDPALWNRLHEPSGEFLLLTEEDFKSPAGSTGLQTLLAHADRAVSDLAEQVRSLAFQPLELLPPLDRAVPGPRAAATATATAPPAGAAAPGAGGLPGWMTGHLAEQPAPAPAAPPVPASPDGFHTRTALDVVVVVLWPLALLATVLLPLTGFPAAFPQLVAPLTLAAVATAFARSRRTERAGARAELATLTRQLAQVEDPVKADAKLRKERAEFEAAETDRQAAYPRAQDRLTAQYHAALQEAEKRRARKQREIAKKIDGLPEERRRALAKALADQQSAYVQNQLARRLISQSPPHGIGPRLAGRLATHGIRTAADFTNYRTVQNSSYNSTGAVLVGPGGRCTSVHGIGEAKAAALVAWRQDVIASAVARQPTALGAPEQQSVEQNIARRRTQLTARRTAVESEAGTARAQAKKRLDEGREQLARENTAAGDRARRQRQEFSRRTAEIQRSSALHGTLTTAVEAARSRRSGLTYVCYVRFLYSGG